MTRAEIIKQVRQAWIAHSDIKVTLNADIPHITGRVTKVATTDAYAIINGWHVPIDAITSVHASHHQPKPPNPEPLNLLAPTATAPATASARSSSDPPARGS